MRNKFEYICLLLIASLIRLLPHETALALGRKLGELGRFFSPERVSVADDNFKQAFPDYSEGKRKIVVKNVFGNLGAGFVEMLRLDMFDAATDLDKYFQIEGEDNVKEALSHGKGCILLAGHIGFWEAGNFVFPALGYKTSVVAKNMENDLVDGYFRRKRETFGASIVDSKKGARKIVKALRNNQLVGILLDQHTKRSQAIRVPFFNRLAYTTPIIAQLAIKNQVPIVSAFCYRQEGGKYLVKIGQPFFLEQPLSDEGIEKATIRLTEVIEKGIEYDVSQWFWVHRRWKDEKRGSKRR